MIVRYLTVCVLGITLCGGCVAQESTPPSPTENQTGPTNTRHGMGGMSAMGRGIMGTVTEVAPDHFLVKNGANEIYTIHYSVNTRVMKQPMPATGSSPDHLTGSGSPPISIKATDIKVGDAIGAGGETDEAAKSVGAVFIMLLDPERARQMREMQGNFGKTWLMGSVTAINEARVTLHSGVDNADHTFQADENTSFRKRRDPITLSDVQVGDNIRVDGSIKNSQFVASAVTVMMPRATGGPAKRPGPDAPR